jgi:leucyl aminopeptidase
MPGSNAGRKIHNKVFKIRYPMMKLSLNNDPLHTRPSDCLVIGVVEDEPLSPAASAVDTASSGVISRMLESGDIETGIGKTTYLHQVSGVAAERVLVAGFGKSAKLNRARFDRACMAAGKALRDHPLTKCHACLQDIHVDGTDAQWRLRQSALAIHRANYLYTTTKRLKDDSPRPLKSATLRQGSRKRVTSATCRPISATPPTWRRKLPR